MDYCQSPTWNGLHPISVCSAIGFDDFAKRATKSVHLANDIQETAVRAGRLLIEAIDANAFPKSHVRKTGEWWDRTSGRVPGGIIAVSPKFEWREGEPLPGDRPEYLEKVRNLSQPHQFTVCWIFAVGSWLVRHFPSRFRHGAAEYDWPHMAMGKDGRAIGKDGKPLRRRCSRDGQPLPDDFVLTDDSPSGTYEFYLDGEIAYRHDFYDEADHLDHCRKRAEVYADACRVLVDLMVPDAAETYVTLDQAAAVCGSSKRTLERYLKNGKLPEPDLCGGHGEAHKWAWSNLRPALEEHVRPSLPVRFPASRVV